MTGHVDPKGLASAPAAPRRAMLAHLRVCPACRSAVAASDPSALFALLALAPIPVEVLDAVSERVRAAAAEEAPAGRRARARGLAAAAVAAAALLTGGWMLLESPVPPPPAARAARAEVEVAPTESVRGVVDVTVGTTQVVMVYNGDLRL